MKHNQPVDGPAATQTQAAQPPLADAHPIAIVAVGDAPQTTDPLSAWFAAPWADAPVLRIDRFHPRSSAGHRPDARARILADADSLHVLFRVEDRFVRSVHEEFNQPVCEDSCVEFFFQPCDDVRAGYYNFEVNCGGAVLCSWITDPRREKRGFARFVPLAHDDLAQLRIHSSMPRRVDPELVDPVVWGLGLTIPFSILRKHALPSGMWSAPRRGVRWRGNLYKCADRTSHPHWASHFPIGDILDFHQPRRFGSFAFV